MKPRKASTSLAAFALFIFVWATTASAASPFKKVSGATVHVPSGIVFPPHVGAFQFVTAKVYGSGGRDVGAQYDIGGLIRGDVYVYPLGTYAKDFNGEARLQQNAIKKTNKEVKLVAESRPQLTQAGRNLAGFRAQYELTRLLGGNKAQRCGSQFYLFRDGPWLVGYRFSYPIEQAGPANKRIADFLRLWQWRAQGHLVQLKRRTGDVSRG
ncbi:MAG: hypothetical protein ACJ8NS_06660 [Chthoniobacterales bacterium]